MRSELPIAQCRNRHYWAQNMYRNYFFQSSKENYNQVHNLQHKCYHSISNRQSIEVSEAVIRIFINTFLPSYEPQASLRLELLEARSEITTAIANSKMRLKAAKVCLNFGERQSVHRPARRAMLMKKVSPDAIMIKADSCFISLKQIYLLGSLSFQSLAKMQPYATTEWVEVYLRDVDLRGGW